MVLCLSTSFSSLEFFSVKSLIYSTPENPRVQLQKCKGLKHTLTASNLLADRPGIICLVSIRKDAFELVHDSFVPRSIVALLPCFLVLPRAFLVRFAVERFTLRSNRRSSRAFATLTFLAFGRGLSDTRTMFIRMIVVRAQRRGMSTRCNGRLCGARCLAGWAIVTGIVHKFAIARVRKISR
ncbi:hypothetical protein DENSPDRAFT_524676 [Dentipellis sp. KUC8613]|nr:hypothetical protein DENSPDRAFT_524676 [Dentipellis sp. KUC8613]